MFVGSKPKLNLQFCLRGVAVGVGVAMGVAVGVGIKWAAGGVTVSVQVGAGQITVNEAKMWSAELWMQ